MKTGNANEVKEVKYHSPRNGDIVKNRTYCRIYDFNRDSWKNLITKLCSPTWRSEEKSKYLPIIEAKLNDRIKKGRCTQDQVNNFMLQMLNKKSKKIENVIVKKDIIESDNENVILTMEEFNKIFNN